MGSSACPHSVMRGLLVVYEQRFSRNIRNSTSINHRSNAIISISKWMRKTARMVRSYNRSAHMQNQVLEIDVLPTQTDQFPTP